MTEKHCLLIKNFPSDLSDLCFSASGEKVLTRAVLYCLADYFRLKADYKLLEVKKKDLECDLDQLLSVLRMEIKLQSMRKDVLDRVTDPHRFYLHGD